MISWIVSFLSGTIGRILLSGLSILGVWLFIKLYYEEKGASKERARAVEAGRINAGKARAIRKRIEKVPSSSLRDRYFRD
jgi:hypothetical protein